MIKNKSGEKYEKEVLKFRHEIVKSVVIEFGKPRYATHMEIEEANSNLENEVLKFLRKGD